MTLIRSGTISGDGPLRINSSRKERMMPAELRVYTVTMGRNVTTMQLSPQGVEEMKALGYQVEPVPTAAEKTLAEKTAAEKAVKEPPADKAQRRGRNK